jgi:hypothetical protein
VVRRPPAPERAFLAGAVFRLRVAAAFRPAAARFGDFRVTFRAVVRFRVAGRVLDAFRAAVAFRLRVAAAFRPAAARFGDFRVVFRAVVRFRVVAALLAVVRFRVVAAFFAAGLRLRAVAGFFAAVFRAAGFRFRVAATFFAVVRFLVAATGAGDGIAASPRDPGIIPPCSGTLGRSIVGVSRCHAGSGGRYGSGVGSRSCVPAIPSSFSSSVSFHGQFRSDTGMQPPPSKAPWFSTPSSQKRCMPRGCRTGEPVNGERSAQTVRLAPMLGEQEAVVLEVRPFDVHGVPFYDVTVGFPDRSVEHARLGAEVVPAGLQTGERVLATRVANMVIELRRP